MPNARPNIQQNMQNFTITLPNKLAAIIKAKIASGDYNDENAVVQDSLQALQDRDEDFETWLRDEIVKGYDEKMDIS